jgi:ATP-dependent Clp protease ATP-binding subunit ClpC
VFDIFTGPAKQAILLAQDEATGLGHDYIGTEDLLVGLAGTGDSPGGLALSERGITPELARSEAPRQVQLAGVAPAGGITPAASLATIGIDVDEIRRRAEDNFGPGRFVFPRPAFTARAKKALELSVQEAQALGHDYIGTEHVLLGLLAEGEGIAVRILSAAGVDPAELRSALLARARQP